VIDAYTKRLFYRHNLADTEDDYHTIQKIFMRNLKHDVKLFNEYHALIVRLGKEYCRTTPHCGGCPFILAK